MKVHHKIIPAVFLVLMKGDQVLLQRRENTGHGDGFFSLVGGHVDKNESAIKALCREAKEEINICISPTHPQLIYTLYRNCENEERIDLFFRVIEWEGQIAICEQEKCSELKFFQLKDLPKDVLLYISATLKAIRRGENYGEIGWKSQNESPRVKTLGFILS